MEGFGVGDGGVIEVVFGEGKVERCGVDGV